MPMCIRCGREVDTLVDGRLCPSCYLEVYGLGEAPKELRITVCPRCGSYRYQGTWYPSPGGIEDVVALLLQARFRPSEHVEYYRVESVEIDEETGEAIATVAGRLRGVPGEQHVRYRVRLLVSRQLCPSCFRRASGAPTAIVQIRGSSGRLGEDEREAVEDVIAGLGEAIQEAMLDVEEVKEGLDIKMLDQNAARTLASKLRSALAASVKETHKVVGQRSDGRRISRITLSVRLPFFTVGSIVGYRDSLAVVEDIGRGQVLVRRLGAERLHRLRVEDAWRLLEKPRYEDEKDVMITAVEPGWIHVQEMSGAYEYLELPRSSIVVEGEAVEGKNARLVVYRGKYYLIVRD